MRLLSKDYFLILLVTFWSFLAFSENTLELKKWYQDLIAQRLSDEAKEEYKGQEFIYNPSFFSMQGYLFSGTLNNGLWQETHLPDASQENKFYLGEIPIFEYITPSQDKEYDNLIIYIGTTFADFEEAAFIHPVTHLLEKQGYENYYIMIPGFFSKSLLAVESKYPPIINYHVANDLYSRIRNFIELKKSEGIKFNKITAIGFSGGATLMMKMFHIDSVLHNNGGEYVFTRGLGFSPIMSPPLTFEIIDTKMANYKAEKEFKKMDWESLTQSSYGMPPYTFQYALTGEGYLTAAAYADYVKNAEYRFFNEFRIVSMKKVADSASYSNFKFNIKIPFLPIRYNEQNLILEAQGHTYHGLLSVYHMDQYKIAGILPIDTTADEYLDPIKALEEIDIRLSVVFSLDDPILANPNFHSDGYIHSKVAKVLNTMTNNNNIDVAIFDRGGHLGYFLDYNLIDWILRNYMQGRDVMTKGYESWRAPVHKAKLTHIPEIQF